MWEGVNMATGRNLDNLIVFVDRNGWQSYKTVDFTVGQNNLADRFRAFGWDTQEIDGHDFDAIKAAVAQAKATPGKPHAIVCDCIKGKVSAIWKTTTPGTKTCPQSSSTKLPRKNWEANNNGKL